MEDNKKNLLYFEATSMRKLYDVMDGWQEKHHKRLLSLNIQREEGMFACIALSNPTEVIICSGSGYRQAKVDYEMLYVST